MITVYEATKRGHRALPTVSWNLASLVDLMRDDLDVTEAVLLDHTMAILYVGWHSTGKGLMEEKAQAYIEHLLIDTFKSLFSRFRWIFIQKLLEICSYL